MLEVVLDEAREVEEVEELLLVEVEVEDERVDEVVEDARVDDVVEDARVDEEVLVDEAVVDTYKYG